jgi:hypothetical protein
MKVYVQTTHEGRRVYGFVQMTFNRDGQMIYQIFGLGKYDGRLFERELERIRELSKEEVVRLRLRGEL